MKPSDMKSFLSPNKGLVYLWNFWNFDYDSPIGKTHGL